MAGGSIWRCSLIQIRKDISLFQPAVCAGLRKPRAVLLKELGSFACTGLHAEPWVFKHVQYFRGAMLLALDACIIHQSQIQHSPKGRRFISTPIVQAYVLFAFFIATHCKHGELEMEFLMFNIFKGRARGIKDMTIPLHSQWLESSIFFNNVYCGFLHI